MRAIAMFATILVAVPAFGQRAVSRVLVPGALVTSDKSTLAGKSAESLLKGLALKAKTLDAATAKALQLLADSGETAIIPAESVWQIVNTSAMKTEDGKVGILEIGTLKDVEPKRKYFVAASAMKLYRTPADRKAKRTAISQRQRANQSRSATLPGVTIQSPPQYGIGSRYRVW